MAAALPDRPEAPPSRPSWGLGDVALGLVLAVVGANLVTTVLLASTGRDVGDVEDLPLSLVAISQAGLWAGLLGVPLWVAARKGRGAVEDFRIRFRARDLWIGGIAGAVLQFPLLPILYLPILRLADRTADELGEPAQALADRATDPLSVILLVLVVGIGAPIVEEVFYRGLFQGALVKRGLPPWAAILLGAVAFGVMHLQLLQLPALVLFGVLAGVLAHRAQRLGPAIWAHIAFNMVTVVALLAL